MLRHLLILSTILFYSATQALAIEAYSNTPIQLSNHAKVSVITCGPGKEIYSVFGHTALRITDPVNGFDKVYNYGTFDFNTPYFYIKFAKGNLAYFLSVTSFEDFAYSYRLENRALSEQVLQVSRDQAQQIYKAVEENLQPDKKYYRYQFFSDNCTTRIYYLLVKSLGKHMKTDTSYIQEQKTYRQLFNPYLEHFPWVRLGMNIGLGLETDQKVSFTQRLFLPAMLEAAISHSTNHKLSLVAEVNSLYTPPIDSQEQSIFIISPLLLLSLIAITVIILSLLEHPKQTSLLLSDYLIFGSTGFLGVILLLLWLFSLHTPTHYNLNLLWLNPLNLLLIFRFFKKRWIGRVYIKSNIYLLTALIVLNPVLNLFVPEFYPVAFMVIIRMWAMLQRFSHIQAQNLA